MSPTIVSVSGFASEVGKTTVICQLLRFTPGWEAIKITGDHHRSSIPAGEWPYPSTGADIISDDRTTRVPGKDTGRYWEAGASAVQWLIGSDGQIENGIKAALGRVRAEGVFVEGGSFLKYVNADYSVMVAAYDSDDIKPSAVPLIPRMDALVLRGADPDPKIERGFRQRFAVKGMIVAAPIFFERDLPAVADLIRRTHLARFKRHQYE